MPRLTIDLPEKFLFHTEIRVRATDLNYGGHVGNDTILTLIHDARVTYYRHLGFQDELRFEGDVGQIIADAAVIYKSEAFLGDLLEFSIGIADINKYGFDMLYLILSKQTGREVARAKTGIVGFDYNRRKIVSLPKKFLEKFV